MAGRPRKNVATGGEGTEGTLMDPANVTGAAGTTRKRAGGTRRRKRGAGVGTASNLTIGTRGRNVGGHDIVSFQAGAEWAMGLGQRGTRQIRTQHRRQARKATA